MQPSGSIAVFLLDISASTSTIGIIINVNHLSEDIGWVKIFYSAWQDFANNPSYKFVLWLLAITSSLSIGLIMHDKKSIIIGGALSLTIFIWIIVFFLLKSTPQKIKSDVNNKKSEEITLLYLFENDFNNLLRHGGDGFITHNNSSQTTIKTKLYLDFESQNKFVGFFIPSTPETFNICVVLAEQYKIAFELENKLMVEMSGPGERPVNISELNFSGRIFIYHEYPLLETQKRELLVIYEKQEVSPQFRGGDYLFKKKEIGKPH